MRKILDQNDTRLRLLQYLHEDDNEVEFLATQIGATVDEVSQFQRGTKLKNVAYQRLQDFLAAEGF